MNYEYNYQNENTEILTNEEIDQISRELGYSEDEEDIFPTLEGIKSTSQSIYSSDRLTENLGLDLLSLKELWGKDFPPSKWVIQSLVPENGITCISGKPKAGKSFLTLYLAICIALGINFLDKFETQQGGVLLVSKEDPQRILKERSKLLTSVPELPLYFCTDSKLFLDTDRFLDEVIGIIQGKEIKIVIIDSFRRIFKGEENSSQVISDVHNRFKKLLEYGISIIFIHHHGKENFFKREAGDKLRGSSDILAMLDCLLIAERKDDQTLKITQSALRSDKPQAPFLVRLPSFDDEHSSYQFLDFIEEETEKKDLAKEDILALLQTGSFSQKDIIGQLSAEGKYGATTIKNALNELVEAKKIDFVTQGNKKIYMLIDQVLEEENEA